MMVRLSPRAALGEMDKGGADEERDAGVRDREANEVEGVPAEAVPLLLVAELGIVVVAEDVEVRPAVAVPALLVAEVEVGSTLLEAEVLIPPIAVLVEGRTLLEAEVVVLDPPIAELVEGSTLLALDTRSSTGM